MLATGWLAGWMATTASGHSRAGPRRKRTKHCQALVSGGIVMLLLSNKELQLVLCAVCVALDGAKEVGLDFPNSLQMYLECFGQTLTTRIPLRSSALVSLKFFGAMDLSSGDFRMKNSCYFVKFKDRCIVRSMLRGLK